MEQALKSQCTWGGAGSGCQAEDRPGSGHQRSVKSFAPAEHSFRGLSGGSGCPDSPAD